MPTVKVNVDATDGGLQLFEAVWGVLEKAFPELGGDAVVVMVPCVPLYFNGKPAPFAEVSGSSEVPLSLVRRIGAVIAPLMDVEVYRPSSGVKDFYPKGSEVPESDPLNLPSEERDIRSDPKALAHIYRADLENLRGGKEE